MKVFILEISPSKRIIDIDVDHTLKNEASIANDDLFEGLGKLSESIQFIGEFIG